MDVFTSPESARLEAGRAASATAIVPPLTDVAPGAAISHSPGVTRPASNQRSPNRKPRFRSPARDFIRKGEKELFLRTYVLRGFAEACALINRPPDTVLGWSYDDPAFATEWHQAKLRKTDLLKPRMDDITDAALKVIETCVKLDADVETLDGPKLLGISLDAAKSHLKGVKVYDADVNVDVNPQVVIREVVVVRPEEAAPSVSVVR